MKQRGMLSSVVICLGLLSLSLTSALSQRSPTAAAAPPCPSIRYSQYVTPIEASSGNKLNQYGITFVNQSPRRLDFLDVHFSINDGDMKNLRMIASSAGNPFNDNQQQQQLSEHAMPITPFVLTDKDNIEYFFTYKVSGSNFACDTELFSATGQEIRKSNSQTTQSEQSNLISHSTSGPARPQEQPVQLSQHRHRHHTHHSRGRSHHNHQEQDQVFLTPTAARYQAMPQDLEAGTPSADSRTSAAEPSSSISQEQAVQENAVDNSPKIRLEDQVSRLDQNRGVCPLVAFSQKLVHVPSGDSADGMDMYYFNFANESREKPLLFLDVHLSLNGSPFENYRLYSDPHLPASERNNEPQQMQGVMLLPDDQLRYAYTYAVQDGQAKRACNTEVYEVIAGNIKGN